MKKSFFCSFLLYLLVSVSTIPAYNHIWGGRISLNVEAPDGFDTTIDLGTSNTALLWYKGQFSQTFQWEMEFGGSFNANFLFGLEVGSEGKFSYMGTRYYLYPQLNKFALYGYGERFSYRVGRQRFKDPSELIVNGPADGFDVSVILGVHTLNFGAAFTGGVFTKQSNFIVTQTDRLRTSLVASPRLFAYAGWAISPPSPLLGASVYLLAQQELTPSKDIAEGSREFHSQYLELSLQGLLGSFFFWDTAVVGQLGQYGELLTLAGAMKLGLSLLPPGGRTRLGVDMLLSTGDDWGRQNYYLGEIAPEKKTLNQYLPLSKVSTQGFVEEFEIGNLFALGAFFSMESKLGKFSWEFRGTTFLRTSQGPVSSSLVSREEQGVFLGQEVLLSLFYRPGSDFGMAFRAGFLYAGESLRLKSELAPYFPVLYKIGLDIFLSF